MRTTIAIEDRVWIAAKAEASARGMSLGEFVTEALRAELARPDEGVPAYPYRAVVYGRPGRVPCEAGETAALLDEDDARSAPRAPLP